NHHSHFKAMKYFKGKIPVYFRGDSTLIDEVAGYKTVLRRFWLKFVYRFVDFAFYVGKNNKDYFLKHGLKKHQLIFAPHAIDNDRFFDIEQKYQQKAEKWRHEIGVLNDDLVFLFVGKFEKKKNPLFLIKLAEFFPDYKFLFVGNGELEQEMKKQAGENVLFLPFQNQTIMPIVYRLGDVFVLPSQGPAETWGLAINEAMACGKTIIVSNKVGCAVDLIQNGENGFIFESNNIEDFKEKITNINSENIYLFGQNSFDIIKNWSFDKIAKAFEQI
ncbi:MAG: glycosyltransferase family 4 protein, partial [Bacteroidota bacterium]|nr:glycosyltransferase family 4 protein [Bacteroidota bacterium]